MQGRREERRLGEVGFELKRILQHETLLYLESCDSIWEQSEIRAMCNSAFSTIGPSMFITKLKAL